MKITESTRLFIGNNVDQNREKQLVLSMQSGRTHLFAGTVGMQNPLDTQIAEKRAAAMEKAKKPSILKKLQEIGEKTHNMVLERTKDKHREQTR